MVVLGGGLFLMSEAPLYMSVCFVARRPACRILRKAQPTPPFELQLLCTPRDSSFSAVQNRWLSDLQLQHLADKKLPSPLGLP